MKQKWRELHSLHSATASNSTWTACCTDNNNLPARSRSFNQSNNINSTLSIWSINYLTMRSLFILFAIISMATAFSPSIVRSSAPRTTIITASSSTMTSPSAAAPLLMGFGAPDPDQKKLTRENEPDDYFRTNTDKMTDQEKIPIAIAGLVGISLPFIAGLIALYAAK